MSAAVTNRLVSRRARQLSLGRGLRKVDQSTVHILERRPGAVSTGSTPLRCSCDRGPRGPSSVTLVITYNTHFALLQAEGAIGVASCCTALWLLVGSVRI